jgi:eukaryotic-like serine/threonine-protein kinase
VNPERYQQIAQLYHAAVEMKSGACAVFLDQACAGDADLRREVESLIAADQEAVDFIETPALEVAAGLLAESESRECIGRQLSHYRIVSLLGAGGMGEVYLAEDVRLGRKVAIKLLPFQFTQDAERVRRFKTEAQAASALNHPNILTIYDVGEVEGLHFIATEYVEGQTLRQRLTGGKLGLAEALDVAVQTASALDAAHRAGIVHRDIKPENLMLRPDGLVKVLDFGLAKLTERRRDRETEGKRIGENSSPLRPSVSPSPSLTEPGKAMGTIHYMSLEQALGQPVDGRSDLFSLGVVLYEMLTGQQPFAGASDAAIYDAILRQTHAPARDLSPELPAELEWVINRALEKEVELRYQTASDLKAALLALKRNSGSGAVAVSRPTAPQANASSEPKRARQRWLPQVAAGALVVLAVAAPWWWRGRKAAQRAAFTPTASFTRLTTQPGRELSPSLSPDGKQLVYAGDEAGNLDIWLQRVSGATAINLTRDSLAADTQPAFSPDGEQIAFRSERDGGGIFLMGATGENVRRLTNQGYNPAWSPDGKEIVYALGYFTDVPSNRSVTPSALYVINVQTGATRQLTAGDAVQPNWSPAGRRIAYWGLHRGGQRDLWTIDVPGERAVPVTEDAAVDWNPVWSPDGNYLYFASDRGGSMNLWRVPVEEETGQVLGAPEPVTTPATYSGYLSFARDGRRLVYAESSYQVNLQEVGFDPVKRQVTGEPRWITRGARIAAHQHISPDGQWIVFNSLGDRQEDLFVIGRDGSGLRQLTNDPAKDRAPRWSPDGQHIIFFSDRTGRYELWQLKPDGSDLRQLTWTSGPNVQMSHWSPDGRTILCSLQQPGAPFLMNPALPWTQQTPQSLPTAGIPEGLIISSWSADGQKLIGFRNGIFTYSFATQQYEQLANFGILPAWLNDNRHALFIASDKLHLLDTQTRQVTELFSVAPRQLQFLSVAPDNRSLVLSVNTTEADIWLATPFD